MEYFLYYLKVSKINIINCTSERNVCAFFIIHKVWDIRDVDFSKGSWVSKLLTKLCVIG